MAPTPNLIRATENYPKVLVSQFLTLSEAVVYQGPASTSTVISTASVCNTSGVTRKVYLSVVKSGGTAGAPNRVAIISLEPEESCIIDELIGEPLGPGDFVSGYCSAASAVSIRLGGAVSS